MAGDRTIDPDRAIVAGVEDATAVLRVGPGGTELHLPAEDLPAGASAGTWVILDLQLQPPLVIGVDERMTRERADGAC